MKSIFLFLENMLHNITLSITAKKDLATFSKPAPAPIPVKGNLLRLYFKPLLLAVILLLFVCVATQV